MAHREPVQNSSRIRKIARIAGILTASVSAVLLALFCLAGAVGFYLAPNYLVTPLDLSKTDAIVVISGGGTERIDYGAELYNKGIAPILIVSGAAREGEDSNAASMKRIAMHSYQVPETAILTDDISTNTLENAQNVLHILQENDSNSITLVTSAYHQRRAYRTFAFVMNGAITIQNAPASVPFWHPFWWWSHPKARILTLSECAKILWSIFTNQYAK